MKNAIIGGGRFSMRRTSLLLLLFLLPAFLSAQEEDIPEVARALMEEAARATATRRIDEAIAKYEKVIELAPELASVYSNLGSLYYAQGKVAEALAVFQRGLERVPADRLLLTNAATAAQQLGRSADALQWIDRAIERSAREASLFSLRATILRSLERPDEALQSIQQALQLEPNEPKYHFALGNLQFQAGRNDEAITAYRRAIELDRNYLRAWYNLGAVLYEAGRYEEALKAYRVALEPIEKAFNRKETVDVAHAPAYANLGAIYLKQKQWAPAVDAYQKAIRLDPRNPSAHYSLAFVYYSTDQFEKAKPEYEAALAIEPSLPLAYLHLAQIAMRKGDHAGAVETLHRGKPYFDAQTKFQALQTLGRAELAIGNRPAARAAYEEALREQPVDVESLLALARIHRQDQNLAEARRLLELAEESAPEKASVLLERVLLAKAGAEQDAELRALEELLRRESTRPELWPLRVERTLIALRQGSGDGARELSALLASAPGPNAAGIPALRILRALYLARSGTFDEARKELAAVQGSALSPLLAAAIDAQAARREDAVRALTPLPGSASLSLLLRTTAAGDLGLLLWLQNKGADARSHLTTASRAHRDWLEVSLALGEILLANRDWGAAADALEDAARCKSATAMTFDAQFVEATIGRNETLCARARQALAMALLADAAEEVERVARREGRSRDIRAQLDRVASLPLDKRMQGIVAFFRGVLDLAAGSGQRARESLTRSLALDLPSAIEAAARKNLTALEEMEKLADLPEAEEEPVSSQVRRTAVVFLPDLPAENEKKLAESISAGLNQVAVASGIALELELFRRAEDARAFVNANRERVGVVIANPEFVADLGIELRARYQFEREGRSTYRRVIVVPAASTVRTAADLRGRSISVVDGLRDPGAPERGAGSVVRAADDLTAMANVLYRKSDAALVSEHNPLLQQHATEQRIIYTSAPLQLPIVALAPMPESDRTALDRGFRAPMAGALSSLQVGAITRIERERPRVPERKIEIATVPPSALGLRLPELPASVPMRVVVDLPQVELPERLFD